MLCSGRIGRSGLNWLDRLRSTKGFPAADNLAIDHFLSPATTAGADSSISLPVLAPPQRPLPDHSQNGDFCAVNVFTNVLSELFSMGDPNDRPKFPGKKIPRKQTNPRICPASASASNRDGEEGTGLRKDDIAPEAASLGSGNNSGEVKEEQGDVEAEEKELVGYSRSEVTVIDTSFPDWKLDKLVFRRKSLWKIRDKKGKPRSFVGTKKRKWGGGCNQSVGIVNKRAEVGLEKKVNGEDSLVPSNEGQNPQNDRTKQTCIERRDDVSKGLKKMSSFCSSPVKPGKGASSVVLIKGSCTTQKSATNYTQNARIL